jgi:hypothetical protein
MIKISKKIVISALALLVLIGISFAGLFVYIANNRLVCESDAGLLGNANNAIKNNDNESLNTVVDKILAKKNYIKDPNCNLILMSYYINISDGNKAKISYENLQKVYNSKKGFSPLLNSTLKGLTVYKSEIDLLIESSNLPVVHFGSGKGQNQ